MSLAHSVYLDRQPGRPRRPRRTGRHARPGRPAALVGSGLLALSVLLDAPAAVAEPGAHGHPEVLVVVNTASEISVAIGESYRRRRGIPAENVVELKIPLKDPTLADRSQESLGRDAFVSRIRDPIEQHLTQHGLRDSVEIIVTTLGVPLRVREPAQRAGANALRDGLDAAVDAELALLFSRSDGAPGVAGSVNPYFDSKLRFAEFRQRNPRAPLRYLTARLTGYPVPLGPDGVPSDVTRLIEAARGREAGRIYLIDEDPRQPGNRAAGNHLLLTPAAAALQALGLTVFHDRSTNYRYDVPQIGGYSSWGSNDRNDPGTPYYGEMAGRVYPGEFTSRAVVADIVSFNGRSFVHPPHYGQSLTADLVRMGAGGAAAHAAEPMLSAVARPHILLRRFAQGVPAAEAFFRSIPYLGWMNFYVGDPLMQLDRRAPDDPADLDGDGFPNAQDNCTEIPNPDQRDTNKDGYGNPCDADVDGDGRVTTSWGGRPFGDLERIRSSVLEGTYIPDHDLDGNGTVNDADVSWAAATLFLAPGPSGLARSAKSGWKGRRPQAVVVPDARQTSAPW